MKIGQIWSYFWFLFSRTRAEYGPAKTPYLDNFHAVLLDDTTFIDSCMEWVLGIFFEK